MNRDALSATAHNGCVQPVRGSYGAVRVASRTKLHFTVRLKNVVLILFLAGGGVAAYFLLAGALSPKPSLRILSPAANAMISSGRTTVTVEARNAELASAAAPTRGYHLHYYLDAIVPTASSEPAIPTTGKWASSTKASQEWSIAGAGLHILAVQLVRADDRPLKPPVVAAVVVQLPKPPSAPAPSSTPSKTPPATAAGGC